MSNEPYAPCVLDYEDENYHTPLKSNSTSRNCIFFVPEQFGGDETNRPNYCAIHGFDYDSNGCKYRKTCAETLI